MNFYKIFQYTSFKWNAGECNESVVADRKEISIKASLIDTMLLLRKNINYKTDILKTSKHPTSQKEHKSLRRFVLFFMHIEKKYILK